MPDRSVCFAEHTGSSHYAKLNHLLGSARAHSFKGFHKPKGHEGMTTLNKIKLTIFIVVSLVLVIIVFQNLAQTEVRLLFKTVNMPQAALLAATLLVGFCMGFFANALWKMRAWRAKAKAAKHKSTENNDSGLV